MYIYLKDDCRSNEPKCIFANTWMSYDGYFFEGLGVLIFQKKKKKKASRESMVLNNLRLLERK